MEQIITLIQRVFVDDDFTILGLLSKALVFVLGVICAEYKMKKWFHHRRVWSRLAVCLVLMIVAVYLDWHVVAVVIFTLLVVVSAFVPLPHELLLLYYYKFHQDALKVGKYSAWLVTTSAMLRSYEMKIKACGDFIERQEMKVTFLDEAKKWDLYDWEYEKYYLPNLDVLFRIGAIKAFEAECLRLVRFDKTSYMLNFKTYLAHNEFYYEKMAELGSQSEDKDDDARLVSALNKLCAYEASCEKEKIKNLIDELLVFKRKGIVHIELYHCLMHYYDEIVADKVAADTLAVEIESMDNIANFEDYLLLVDVAFMHYRRAGNKQKVNELFDKILAMNKRMQKGENQMITSVKLMYTMFDNGYNWQEYSLSLFANREQYLNCGYRVGAVFIKETCRLLKDAGELKNMGLNPKVENEMFDDFDRYSKQYIADIENVIAKLDSRFLYRKRNLLMLKLELLKLRAGGDMVLLRKNNDEIYDRVTEMCRRSGDNREWLHFLVVHADDILTVDNQIMLFAQLKPEYVNAKLQEEYERHRLAYVNKAEEIICEIVDLLRIRNYDKSLAYYVIYTAYFYMLLGNTQRCRFFFTMFEKYDVDIKNWMVPIQNIYNDVSEFVAECSEEVMDDLG